MNEVEEYIYGFEGETLEMMKFLHSMMMVEPGIRSKIAFKIPSGTPSGILMTPCDSKPKPE